MTPEYVEYRPPADGVPPKYWREGMKWTRPTIPADFDGSGHPEWLGGWEYHVEPEALTAPNDDASGDYHAQLTRLSQEYSLSDALALLRGLPAEELAKHGITLAPEKDVFVELLADVLDAWGISAWNVSRIRSTTEHSWQDKAAIELLRQRFEQMKGAR